MADSRQVTLDEYLGQSTGGQMNTIVGVREFRQRQGRSVERFWQTWLEDDFVCTVWGAVVDGKRKEHGKTKDRPGPKGKDGTKGYVDAYANARFNLERDIRKKTEEGYIEVGMDGQPLVGGVILPTTIDFSKPLPKNLCFSKPKQKVSGDFVAALEQKDDLFFTLKRNGMAVVVQILEDGTPAVYVRRMDKITDHVPHLVRAMKALRIPAKSILMFESYVHPGNTKRDLNKCSEIMRCKQPEKALARQQERGWLRFYLYRIPFWRGEHLESKHTCLELAHLIENTLGDKFIDHRDSQVKGRFLYTLETFEGSVTDAMALAEKEGYEGWVAYQKSAMIADYSFSFDGKAHRPVCAFKMKLADTDDFRAYWRPDEATKERPMGTWGTGKNMGKVGTLSLYQLNSKGEEVYISDTSGFTDEERERLGKIKNWPICVEVKFDSRFYKSQGDKTNSLDFPRYQRQRDDKTCEECIDEEL